MRIVVPTANASTLVSSYLAKLQELARLDECQGVKIGRQPVNGIPTSKLDALCDAQVLTLVQGIIEGKVQKFDLNGRGLFLFASAFSYNGLTEIQLAVRDKQHDLTYGLFVPNAQQVLAQLASQLKAA